MLGLAIIGLISFKAVVKCGGYSHIPLPATGTAYYISSSSTNTGLWWIRVGYSKTVPIHGVETRALVRVQLYIISPSLIRNDIGTSPRCCSMEK